MKPDQNIEKEQSASAVDAVVIPSIGFKPDHELKCWPGPFSQVALGIKRAEFRRNDRGFITGDWLLLREWIPDTRRYTGRHLCARVTCVTSGFGIPQDYVMLSIKCEPMVVGV